MKTAIVGTLIGILALSLAGCGGSGSISGDPLDGTAWELAAYRKSRPISGTTITATFEDGRVYGSGGCNSYSGSYQVSGDAITVGALAWTEMACLEPDGVMEQEVLVMAYLADAQTFRLAEGQLLIVQSEGEALTFTPQQ